MKYTTVTKQNMPLILHRINQFLQRNEVVSSYSDWGRYPKEMNKLGAKNELRLKFVERTLTSYILKSKYSIRLDLSYGIVIHVHSDCAISITLKDKVKIYSNRIVIKGWCIALEKSYTSYFMPSTEIEKAIDQHDFEEAMAQQYWDDYNMEFLENEMNEELEENI